MEADPSAQVALTRMCCHQFEAATRGSLSKRQVWYPVSEQPQEKQLTWLRGRAGSGTGPMLSQSEYTSRFKSYKYSGSVDFRLGG